MKSGAASALRTPYPLVTLMPSVFQDDSFTTRWTSGLDDVLAPIIASIDCLAAYLDPLLAPTDFLEWMAAWLGATLDENWPETRRRAVISQSAELYRQRGTVGGLRRHLELVTGGRVELRDSGGVSTSTRPGARLPGDHRPALAIRVVVPDPDLVDHRALDSLVTMVKPAHVPHTLEVVSS
ncbi:phage tail protein [Lentzea sp. NPDC051208]|uniref:phage tail protein n=1 Tax=Lentzea sp. NPDC051208 TaxID=3154642 RepID=UPI0034390FD7